MKNRGSEVSRKNLRENEKPVVWRENKNIHFQIKFNNKDKFGMYKQLVTYNFSNDETRESFEEMIEDMGFEKQGDQSTYTLRARSDVSVREMKNEIVNWSECVESYIDVEDRVDLYYVTVAELDEFNKVPVIDSISFVYDVETEGLVEE